MSHVQLSVEKLIKTIVLQILTNEIHSERFYRCMHRDLILGFPRQPLDFQMQSQGHSDED